MGDAAVLVDGVWKKFRRGERHDSLRDLIPFLTRWAFSRRRPEDLGDEEFWALCDVTFQLARGETLGIIGPNGAGKSTILKVLTKILKPTQGHCAVRGRVGALIEVAAGFHPDLTGRENIYLQGAVMGMTRSEIAAKFDAIIEFAGVHEFIDTPVKRYSSGMNARLGFSIAAHLDPEVLLVDEVLSVGDMAFQQRCFDRMASFRKSGVAIVFASHNLSAIASLCDAVLVLRRGKVHVIAPPREAIAAYASFSQESDATVERAIPAEAFVEVRNARDEPVQEVEAGEMIAVRALIRLCQAEGSVACGIRIRRADSGEAVAFVTTDSVGCRPVAIRPPAGLELRWSLRANLTDGQYSIELVLFDANTERIITRLNAAAYFLVTQSKTAAGLVYLAATCSTTVIDSARRVYV